MKATYIDLHIPTYTHTDSTTRRQVQAVRVSGPSAFGDLGEEARRDRAHIKLGGKRGGQGKKGEALGME